jgi:hypothetical protein
MATGSFESTIKGRDMAWPKVLRRFLLFHWDTPIIRIILEPRGG